MLWCGILHLRLQVLASGILLIIDKPGAQAERFGTALASARVVQLWHADHYVFQSNEADVLREMNAFLSGLSVAIQP
jgi:hypothetical protein